MKIVVTTRCLNELDKIERFVYSYSFADVIVVSDGGSTDGSLELLQKYDKVKVVNFSKRKEFPDGSFWNPDNPHIQHAINCGKEENPDWLILDDIDDVPNYLLREKARDLLWTVEFPQVNAFRLYMWGEDKYFPEMNRRLDEAYTSLWAWKPDKLDIKADLDKHHGTIIGTTNTDVYKIKPPMCLLHYSWNPETIDKKLEHYKKVGIDMAHPFDMKNAGTAVDIPEWAKWK